VLFGSATAASDVVVSGSVVLLLLLLLLLLSSSHWGQQFSTSPFSGALLIALSLCSADTRLLLLLLLLLLLPLCNTVCRTCQLTLAGRPCSAAPLRLVMWWSVAVWCFTAVHSPAAASVCAASQRCQAQQ
jgi:hypothetical protein